MLELSLSSNPLIQECNNFKKRILNKNKKLDPKELMFQILTEEYIENLTFGMNQLKKQNATPLNIWMKIIIIYLFFLVQNELGAFEIFLKIFQTSFDLIDIYSVCRA